MKRLALFTTAVAFTATLSAAPLALGDQRPATHAQVENRGFIRSKLNAVKGRLDPTKKGRENRKEVRRINRLRKHVKNVENPRRGLKKLAKKGAPRKTARTARKRRANPGKPIKNLAKGRRR